MARKSKRTKNSCKIMKKHKNVARSSLKTSVSKLVKNRLTRITNLIRKHINNAKKRISPQDAQNYLQELESMKMHWLSNVLSNIHYSQVHEKLSKQMSLIMEGNDQLDISEKETEMQTEVQIDDVLSTKMVTEISREKCMAELRSTQTTPSDILNIDDLKDLTGDVTSLDAIEIDKPVTHITSAKRQILVLRDASKDFNRNNNLETALSSTLTELNYVTPTTCTNDEFKAFICDDHNYFTTPSLMQSSDIAIVTNCLVITALKESVNAENLLNGMLDSNASTPEIHPNHDNIISHLHNLNNDPITSMILDIEESMVSEDHLQTGTPNNNSQFNLPFESNKNSNTNNALPVLELNKIVNEKILSNSAIKCKAPTDNESTKEVFKKKTEIVNLYVRDRQQNNNSMSLIIDNIGANNNVEAVNPITSLITNFEALETVNNVLDLQQSGLSELSQSYTDDMACQVPVTSNGSYKKDCNVLNSNSIIEFHSKKFIDSNVTRPNYGDNRKHDIVTDENLDNSEDGVISSVNNRALNSSGNSAFDWFKDLKFIRDINNSEYFSNAVLPEGFWSNESLPKEWEADFDIWD